jgi:pantoate--beta-alanine ligase
MRTLRTVSELRTALSRPRQAGSTIGLVPTMGAFHDGHLSLMRRAREDCDEVVVSLFVNPTQFNESTDLDAYPRDEVRDAALAAELGVDYLFAPASGEVYPDGFATMVSVAGLTEVLEAAERGREHFDGVVTVVTKLFNMVGPTVAYFGQKDAQQTVVIRRLVRDLDLPVRIEICPTVREPDGLAMSSRNVRLSPAEREQATALSRALLAAEQAAVDGERSRSAVLGPARAVLKAAGVQPEYLELVSAETLAPLKRLDGEALVLVAARIGPTRLIDNQPLSTVSAKRATRPSSGTARRPARVAAAGSTNHGRN